MSNFRDRRLATRVTGPRRLFKSGADKLSGRERQGLFLDFTTRSVKVADATTAANIRNPIQPSGLTREDPITSLLTHTSPSPKMTMGPNGLLRYGAHNLYLNSAAPANQSITVVSGATYAVTITGTVSVTASGAATGTWTAGTNTFTAATTTLTLGSTSGSGTVHVRRTPSDATYLETAGSVRYALPYTYNATTGACEGILVEEARTNLCLYSNDLTNAAWTKTNCTAAKTAEGPDGVANSASTLTATAVNGVALQNITSASAARSGSVFLKRRTGTGAVSIAIGETTGGELVSNGTFDTDTTGWTASTGDVSAVRNGSGQIEVTNNGVGVVYQEVTVTPGKFYRVLFDWITKNGGGRFQVRSTLGGSILAQFTVAGTGQSTVFLSTTSSVFVQLGDAASGVGTVNVYDNISILEVAESTIDLSSGEWVRASIENKTITNPCLAIKLATSGDAVDVAYADLENGAFVTSPIETFASSVTRAADNISIATTAFPYSATAGTALIEVTPSALSSSSYLYAFTDGTTSERVSSFCATNQHLVVSDNIVLQCNIDAGTLVSGQKNSLAAAWELNDFAVVISGGAAGTDNSGTLPSPNILNLGARAGALEPMTGLIHKMAYFPTRKSNAELQTLTSP